MVAGWYLGNVEGSGQISECRLESEMEQEIHSSPLTHTLQQYTLPFSSVSLHHTNRWIIRAHNLCKYGSGAISASALCYIHLFTH